MPSSNTKSVLKKEQAENLVLEFTPRALDAQMSNVAKEFLSDSKKRPTTFRLSELVAQQTGISEVERLSLNEKIEARALEKVKEVQESAYKEAYALGLEEGRQKAFDEEKAEITRRLGQLDEVLVSVTRLKSELTVQNEAHIIRLIFELAKKLFFSEVNTKDDRILPVLKQAIDLAQSEESVTVRISEEDFKFVDEFRTKVSKEFDFLKRMKFEPSPEIERGGCLLETNYGVIDATIEERVGKLWTLLSEKLPKVKSSNKT
ncbi:MAG: FliH/SctL family protein [Bdellovibrionia bacterium]